MSSNSLKCEDETNLNPRQQRLLRFFLICLFMANVLVFGNVYWSQGKLGDSDSQISSPLPEGPTKTDPPAVK